MIWLLVSGAVIALFLWLLRAFTRASVTDVKVFLSWFAALAGVSLAAMLVITGRGWSAVFALVMLAPLLWDIWLGPAVARRRAGAAREAGQGREPPRRPNGGGMSRDEAYAVLGLKPGASDMEIRAAYRRLMAAAHPDKGGSDWIAARLNQARDVLLG